MSPWQAFTVELILPVVVGAVAAALLLWRWPMLRHLWRREVLSLVVTPSTYVVLSLFVLIASFVFYLVPLQEGVALLEPVIQFVKFLGIFFVPLLTMRLFAEERRAGTMELLMTAPACPVEVVLAKYGAALVLYFAMLAPLWAYAGLLLWAGRLDIGLTQVGLLGLLLLGAAYAAVGLFVSSLTRSQIAAAMGAIAILLSLWLVWWIGGEEPGWVPALWRHLSFKHHFDRSFGKGVIDSADLIYLVSLSAAFLFLTWLVVSTTESFGRGAGRLPRRRLFALVALLGVAGEALLVSVAALDIQEMGVPGLWEAWEAGRRGDVFWVLAPLAAALLAGGGALVVLRSWRGLAAALALLIMLGLQVVLEPADLGRQILLVAGWLGVLALTGWCFSQLVTRRTASTLTGAAAVLVLMVNLNVAAGWQPWRQDRTDEKLNELDSATREVLALVTEPVEISVFLTSEDQYDSFPLLAMVRSLLEEYQAHCPALYVRYFDPLRVPLQAREAAVPFGLEPGQLPAFVGLRQGSRNVLLNWEMIVTRRRNALGREERVFQGELALTSALRRLLDPRRVQLYFTTGHGEYNLHSMDRSPRNLGRLARSLGLAGYQCERLSLVGLEAVPADCDLLVLAGPIVPYRAPELAVLEAYLQRGGRMFVLLDPRAKADTGTPLVNWLKRYGVRARDDLLLDTRYNANGDASAIRVEGSSSHPISASRVGLHCYLLQARSLGIAGAPEGWKAEALLMSSSRAQSFRIDERGKMQPMEKAGPFACGVALNGPVDSRMVVLGDADLAGNFAVELGHNRTFLLSAVHWLVRQAEAPSIAERLDVDRRLTLSGPQHRFLWWVALVGVPQLYWLAGLAVWWLRRQ